MRLTPGLVFLVTSALLPSPAAAQFIAGVVVGPTG